MTAENKQKFKEWLQRSKHFDMDSTDLIGNEINDGIITLNDFTRTAFRKVILAGEADRIEVINEYESILIALTKYEVISKVELTLSHISFY